MIFENKSQLLLLATLVASIVAPLTAFVKKGADNEINFGNKVDREEDSIILKIFSEIRGINSKVAKIQEQVDGIETRLNKSQAETTTMVPAWRYKGGYIAPTTTTTPSPQDVCTSRGGFACYNDTSICVDAAKLCDKTADCADESDECFCTSDAPEQIIGRPSECPHGYFGSKTLRKCYYFSSPSNGVNWIEALIDCTKRAAKMVTIESRLEQDAIVRFLKERKEQYTNSSIWLGATNALRSSNYFAWLANVNVNSMWKWISNERSFSDVGYNNWIKKPVQQPDNVLNFENCLEMRDDFSWGWNDKDCRSLNSYICEIPMPEGQRKFPDEDNKNNN